MNNRDIKLEERISRMTEFAKKQYNEGKGFSPMYEIVAVDQLGEVGHIIGGFDNDTTENRFTIMKSIG